MTHIVLFQLTDPTDAPEAAQRLLSMAGRIAGLESVTAGPNASGDEWHLGLVTVHRDAAALAAYATDPVHLEVVEWLKPRIAVRALVDVA